MFKQVAASKINQTESYTILVTDDNGKSEKYQYNITAAELQLPWTLAPVANNDVRSYRVQKKAKNFRTTIQAFTQRQFFFPTPGLFNFSCNIQKNFEEVNNCSIRKFVNDSDNAFPYRKFTFTMLVPVFDKDNKNKIRGFTHGNSIQGVSNRMIANCYQQVSEKVTAQTWLDRKIVN